MNNGQDTKDEVIEGIGAALADLLAKSQTAVRNETARFFAADELSSYGEDQAWEAMYATNGLARVPA